MRPVIALMMMATLLVTPSLVGAQGGIVYTSGFQVQNLSATTANIVVVYYKQDGTTDTTVSDTILGNSSKTYYPIAASTGFNGSVVISSDQQVVAIVNVLGNNPAYGDSYNGFTAGATSLSLPLVMCNNSGFNTWFNIQNVGASDANVTITYAPGSDGVAGSETATIKPNAARTFDQTTGSATKNCSTLAGSSGKFIGSAAISSSQPVVATVMQLGTSGFNIMMAYNGFTAGSTTANLPLIMANNSGFYTGIQVANAGSGSATVRVKYGPNTAGSFAPVDETFTLAAGASKTIIQNSNTPGNGSVQNWTATYVGSAIISQDSTSQPLVAIVNQVWPGVTGVGPFGAAYAGFDPTKATTKISTPLIMANNSNYHSGIQVQNVSSGSVNVTITYGPNTAGSFAPTAESFALAAGAAKTIIQDSIPAANGGVNDWTGKTYIGSSTITANGNIVAIVDQVNLTVAGDQFFAYGGSNY